MKSIIEKAMDFANNDGFNMGVIASFLSINAMLDSLIIADSSIGDEKVTKIIKEMISNELNKDKYYELLKMINEII